MLYVRPANFDDIEKEYLFVRDIPEEENSFINEWHGISREDFEHIALPAMIDSSHGLNLPDGYVPDTTLFLWDDDEIVGQFRIRHHLCPSLIEGAGHIGYFIAKPHRNRGCGREGLRLALEYARNIVPEDEIYLRTDRTNHASLRVMLANGGYIHHEDDIKYYVRIKNDRSAASDRKMKEIGYKIRFITREEYPVLSDFLYEAIFIPDGIEPPPRSIIERDELQVYIRDFGTQPADRCLVAEADGRIVGAVWVRIMNDYGNIDESTPSFAISLYKEYRGRGIGTQLMLRMLDVLRAEGRRQASLAVQKANYAAKMYRKVGFEVIDENDEEYIMLCRLNG